jgi:hypothetical protein
MVLDFFVHESMRSVIQCRQEGNVEQENCGDGVGLGPGKVVLNILLSWVATFQ